MPLWGTYTLGKTKTRTHLENFTFLGFINCVYILITVQYVNIHFYLYIPTCHLAFSLIYNIAQLFIMCNTFDDSAFRFPISIKIVFVSSFKNVNESLNSI